MREILFRGKRNDNGEWVYGSFCKDAIEQEIGLCGVDGFIRLYDADTGKMQMHEVDRKTVGQFTGLTNNGKKIFEGDIVRVLGNQQVDDWKNVDYVALIAFLDGGFCAIDGTVEEHGFRRYALARMDFSLEIIGNQFDNPELIGGETNGA
jgi:uncharacterized phage protein (TIGR01671 family)